MTRATPVAVVGAGRVGTAVAVLLQRAGRRIAAVSGRDPTRRRATTHLPDVPFVSAADAAARGQVVLVGVPDDAIAPVSEEIAGSVGAGAAVVHLSGAAPLRDLDAVRGAGATVLSVHPLQTVPDVEAGIDRIPGSAAAITAHDEEGHLIGESLALDLGTRPFRLPDERKALYHAAAVFASNYLVTVEAVAERLFDLAGVEEPVAALTPLARASLDHALDRGPATALTGPAARGDSGTIRRNLEALAASAPHAVQAYVALARAAVHLARAEGRVGDEGVRAVEEVLGRWT